MCDPLSLTIAATAVSAGGQVIGGLQSAASYRAQGAFADRQATLEAQRGAYEAARTAEQNDRRLAEMRGSYLSSGVALDGSPADVIADSATQASLDEQAIRYGARLRSGNLRYEGQMARMNANNAMIGGFMSAAGTALGGWSEYQDYQSRRTFMTNPYVAYGGGY